MEGALAINRGRDEQDHRIAETVRQEQSRLRNFIRKRVGDEDDAEEILQDVFYELVEAYRLMQPIEQVGAWLFQVARNRIIDWFRKKRPVSFPDRRAQAETEAQPPAWEELLPSPDAGPEAIFARGVLFEELEAALDELPEEQREVFLAHEVEGRSFKELSAESGVAVNTLLSRKHYAVVHLRERLQAIYGEFKEVRDSEK
jgi:RNA polymerase sigma factor (sigma-70 family)